MRSITEGLAPHPRLHHPGSRARLELPGCAGLGGAGGGCSRDPAGAQTQPVLGPSSAVLCSACACCAAARAVQHVCQSAPGLAFSSCTASWQSLSYPAKSAPTIACSTQAIAACTRAASLHVQCAKPFVLNEQARACWGMQVRQSQEAVTVSNIGGGGARWMLRLAPPALGGSPQDLPDWLAACPTGGFLMPQVRA